MARTFLGRLRRPPLNTVLTSNVAPVSTLFTAVSVPDSEFPSAANSVLFGLRSAHLRFELLELATFKTRADMSRVRAVGVESCEKDLVD